MISVAQSIPTYVQEKIVDEEGNISAAWSYWFQQVITYLQNNFSQEGFVVPNLPTATINQITTNDNASASPKYVGGLYYDTTTNQLKVNINGTIKIVTVT